MARAYTLSIRAQSAVANAFINFVTWTVTVK
jgi:hypothetical protein